ncbi:MAG: serine hydrolase [Pseudomonadota bacterium]
MRTNVMTSIISVLSVFAFGASAHAQSAGAITSDPEQAAIPHGVAMISKIVCSSVFISGMDAQQSLVQNALPMVTEGRGERFDIPPQVVGLDIDEESRRVTASLFGIERTAGFYDDQGCVIHPAGFNGVYFEPLKSPSTLPPADAQAWPMGDAASDDPLPDTIDDERLLSAVDAAFGDGSAHTAAFVVVHDGRIVAERYGAGADKNTPLASWSMGKSLTATLLAVLMQQGEDLELDAPAPISAWGGEGDLRGAITLRNLLNMSSGLRMAGQSSPQDLWAHPTPDHGFIYMEAIDVFDFAVNRGLQFEPGTVGRYRNSDPLAIGYIIKQTVEARGQNYLTFPQTDLFDKIGVRNMVLEPDAFGNFVMTGFEYGSARDWARLGQLYLQDGVWEGQRILPEGWADFVSTPAPAWEDGMYGGQFWLKVSEWRGDKAPADAYSMNGGGVQNVIIIPSLNAVIVRMGHYKGARSEDGKSNPASAALSEAVNLVVEALQPN